MKYLGGKHTIGKDISELLNDLCPSDLVDGYIEPFCGSLGVFKQMVDKDYNVCIASDAHSDLIEMWKKLQDNTLKLPKTISEKQYYKLKEAKSPNALKAVAGFGLSFGGVYFQSYSQKYAGDSNRNFYNEMKRSLDKIAPLIRKKNIKFYNKSYEKWNPKNMLIYCDPPYEDTASYSTGNFDHDKFWNTMRKWSKHNYVFISEENAPKDFKIIWKKEKWRTVSAKKRAFKTEKMFVYKGGLVNTLKPRKKTRKQVKIKQKKTRKK